MTKSTVRDVLKNSGLLFKNPLMEVEYNSGDPSDNPDAAKSKITNDTMGEGRIVNTKKNDQ